jgi:hypothetical protein
MKKGRFLRVLLPRKGKFTVKNVKIGKNHFLKNMAHIIWEFNCPRWEGGKDCSVIEASCT